MIQRILAWPCAHAQIEKWCNFFFFLLIFPLFLLLHVSRSLPQHNLLRNHVKKTINLTTELIASFENIRTSFQVIFVLCLFTLFTSVYISFDHHFIIFLFGTSLYHFSTAKVIIVVSFRQLDVVP